MAAYFRPSTLAEALAIRARQPVTVLAGGTDVYPARASRVGWGDMRRDDILDISALRELKGIVEEPGRLRMGALTTWDEMRRAALQPAFAGYQKAARDVGGAQVQNRGTLVGNICTASTKPGCVQKPIPLPWINRRMPFTSGMRASASNCGRTLAPFSRLAEATIPWMRGSTAASAATHSASATASSGWQSASTKTMRCKSTPLAASSRSATR